MECLADPSVVLMDELDQLLTAKQDVVYNFFNWPTMRDSQLFVIAVANRMDLPQHLAAKIKSRLGVWRFMPSGTVLTRRPANAALPAVRPAIAHRNRAVPAHPAPGQQGRAQGLAA